MSQPFRHPPLLGWACLATRRSRLGLTVVTLRPELRLSQLTRSRCDSDVRKRTLEPRPLCGAYLSYPQCKTGRCKTGQCSTRHDRSSKSRQVQTYFDVRGGGWWRGQQGSVSLSRYTQSLGLGIEYGIGNEQIGHPERHTPSLSVVKVHVDPRPGSLPGESRKQS